MVSPNTFSTADDERAQSELIWSLVITTVTVVAAWLHFQHSLLGLQGRGALCLHALYIVLCPTFPIVLLVLSLLPTVYFLYEKTPVCFTVVESGEATVTTSTNTRSIKFTLWSVCNGPFAAVIVYHVESERLEIKIAPPTTAAVHIRFGHVVVLLAMACQAGGSFTRGVRRIQEPSAAMTGIDWRILWTSLTGLVTIAQTALLEATRLTTDKHTANELIYQWLMLAVLKKGFNGPRVSFLNSERSAPWEFFGGEIAYGKPPQPNSDTRSSELTQSHRSDTVQSLSSVCLGLTGLYVLATISQTFSHSPELDANLWRLFAWARVWCAVYLGLVVLLGYAKLFMAVRTDLMYTFCAPTLSEASREVCPQLWKDPRFYPAF